METLPFVVTLLVGGASLVVGAWLSHWRKNGTLSRENSSSASSTRIQSPVASFKEWLRAAAKSSFHT